MHFWFLDSPGEQSPELSADEVPAQPATEDPSPAAVLHDAAARLLTVQISTDDVLNTRNASIFSVGSTILPVTIGLLGLARPEREIQTRAEWTLILALVCYGLLLISSWRASFIRGLEYRPSLHFLNRYTDEYSGTSLQEWVALEYLASTDANDPRLRLKAKWVGIANTLVYIEAFLLSLAALLTFL